MGTYIAMLRGINVSGQKKIKMADLREHLSELNFDGLQTYIQSGNIVFSSDEREITVLESQIREKIKEKYGFDVPTIVKAPEDFKYVIDNNPFLKQPEKELKRQYITFLAEAPDQEKVDQLMEQDYSPEEWVVDGKFITGFSPEGFARAKLSNNFFEQKLKVAATTRNWKTVNVLYEMALKN